MDKEQKKQAIEDTVKTLIGQLEDAGYSFLLLAGDMQDRIQVAKGALTDLSFHMYSFLKSASPDTVECVETAVNVARYRRKLGQLPTDSEISELFKKANIDDKQ